MQTQDFRDDVKQLNSFLQDELSAVATYEQCIDKVDDPTITSNLLTIKQSHEARVDLLRSKIQELGGEPETTSGMWGSFAKMVEGGAKLFGEKAAVNALEQGEDRGRDNYNEKADDLSPQVRAFIDSSILPEQLRSHEMLNRVRAMIH